MVVGDLQMHSAIWSPAALRPAMERRNDVGIIRLKVRCVAELHGPPYSGHLGITKTLKQAERMLWWPHMRRDVEYFVRTCDICQKCKPSNQKPAGKLQPLQIPGRRWESVSVDFITHLPETPRGHTSIVVFVCRLTKMVHFVPTRDDTGAAVVAQLFFENVWRHHGLCRDIVSDRDTRFTSKFWAELTKILGINRHMSTAYHPQTDGQTERVNRTLEDMLRRYIDPQQSNWDTLLLYMEFAVNNAWQESVQNTPFFLNHGQHPLTPLSADLEAKVPAAEHLARTFTETIAEATQALKDAQSRQKNYADKHRREQPLHVGDMVLLSTANCRVRASNTGKASVTKKLQPKFAGPYKVVQQVGRVAYKLELPKTKARVHDVFYVNLLKPYHRDGARQPPPGPPLFDLDDDDVWEVEAIVSDRMRRTRGSGVCQEYLIKWKNFPSEQNTWEPEHNLINCESDLQEYWDKQRREASARGSRKRKARGAQRPLPSPSSATSAVPPAAQSAGDQSRAHPNANKRVRRPSAHATRQSVRVRTTQPADARGSG